MTKRGRSGGSKKMKMLGILKLKIVLEKLMQRGGRKFSSSSCHHDDLYEEMGADYHVPEDVKKGHFAVVAMDEEGPRRFIVPLRFLAHPRFLELLDQAAEEYGFDHEGALMMPCHPSLLEELLADEWLAEEAYV